MPVAITGYHQGTEPEAFASLNHLGHPVNVNELVIQGQFCRVYPTDWLFHCT